MEHLRPPAADIADPEPVYANLGGNHYDKYGTRNPIARALMSGFLTAFDSLVTRAAPRTAYEVGCGEGHLSLRLIERGIATRGCDMDPAVVTEANAAAAARGFGTPFRTGSLYRLGEDRLNCDLIVCCEVLEHLPEPERALDILHAQSAQHVILSVPREPVWRMLNMARAKYLNDWGNTPGHVQHWSSRRFVDLVSSRFKIVAQRHPFPWTMVLARPR